MHKTWQPFPEVHKRLSNEMQRLIFWIDGSESGMKSCGNGGHFFQFTSSPAIISSCTRFRRAANENWASFFLSFLWQERNASSDENCRQENGNNTDVFSRKQIWPNLDVFFPVSDTRCFLCLSFVKFTLSLTAVHGVKKFSFGRETESVLLEGKKDSFPSNRTSWLSLLRILENLLCWMHVSALHLLWIRLHAEVSLPLRIKLRCWAC